MTQRPITNCYKVNTGKFLAEQERFIEGNPDDYQTDALSRMLVGFGGGRCLGHNGSSRGQEIYA